MDSNDIISRANQAVAGLLDRLPETPVPSPRDYVSQMEYLQPLVAVLILGAGLVILLQGWRIFRVWVVVTAAMVGVAVGGRVSQLLHGPYVQVACPIAGGLLLAVLAWPLMKYALGLIGAVTGGLLGHSLLRYLSAALERPDLAQYAWAGAIVGGLLLGVSAFFLFRMVVILSSSLQGSVMVVSGIVAVLLKYPPIRRPLTESLVNSPHVLPLLVALPAVLGVFFQFLWTSPHKPAKQDGS